MNVRRWAKIVGFELAVLRADRTRDRRFDPSCERPEAQSACVMVDRYTNWTDQTDFPDGFADCGVLRSSRRTVRTVTTTLPR